MSAPTENCNISTKYDYLGILLPRMRYLCILRGDLSRVRPSLTPKFTPQGQQYWQVEYQVVVTFGGTRMRAHLQWYEGVSVACFLPFSMEI